MTGTDNRRPHGAPVVLLTHVHLAAPRPTRIRYEIPGPTFSHAGKSAANHMKSAPMRPTNAHLGTSRRQNCSNQREMTHFQGNLAVQARDSLLISPYLQAHPREKSGESGGGTRAARRNRPKPSAPAESAPAHDGFTARPPSARNQCTLRCRAGPTLLRLRHISLKTDREHDHLTSPSRSCITAGRFLLP